MGFPMAANSSKVTSFSFSILVLYVLFISGYIFTIVLSIGYSRPFAFKKCFRSFQQLKELVLIPPITL
jgi:hypothetical protein